ncbi:TPR-like protein [Diaporthe eres]|nr:TPR-like protein [Diaporthe eres]
MIKQYLMDVQWAATTAIISKFDAFIIVATRNENTNMHKATTTNCPVEVDAGLNTTNGTTRKRPVMIVVIRRPRRPRVPCASTPLAPHRLDSFQYRKSRSSLWIQCETGSARDRGGRSSLKSLVSYISGNDEGHEELGSLEELECVQLLLKTARISEVAHDTGDDVSPDCLVKNLGYHTLAILHAGSYIATTHCNIAEYLALLRTNRRHPRQKSRGQGQSRYNTVYATFEASIEFLEQQETGVPEKTRKDAVQLLEVLSTFHHVSVPLDVLEDAWKGVKLALKTPEKLEMHSEKLTAWHVAQVPDLVRTVEDDVRFCITEAVARLESLALVRTDRSASAWESVSMHPLVHSWAGDRYGYQEKKKAYRMAECVVALSHFAFGSWRPYYHQLTPHLKLLVESDVELVHDAAQYRCALQSCVQIAWTQHWADMDSDMYKFTSRIFHRLGLHDQEPTEELREVYVEFATAVNREGIFPAHAVEVLESIARLDKKTRDEDDGKRLSILHELVELGNTLVDIGKTKEAVAVLENVVKARQELGEEHLDLLMAQHELAKALSTDQRPKDAIKLLESVGKIRERLLLAHDPDRLSSQQVLAAAYFRNGQTAEVTILLQEVVREYELVHGEKSLSAAATQHWLAGAYWQNGRLSESIALFERVLNIRTFALGEEHPALQHSYHDLASAYLDAGSVSEAIDMFEQVVRIRNSSLEDTDHRRLESLDGLGRAYLEAQRISEAIEILEPVVKTRKHI